MKYKIAAVLILALAASTVYSQCVSCSNGRCFIQKPARASAPQYQWLKHDTDPNRWYLYANDTLIGGFDINARYFRPYDAVTDTWGEKAPESDAARALPRPEPPQQFFGVDTSKLSGLTSDQYTVYTTDGCRHVSKQEAHKIVGQKLQDDSNKLRVTIIGDDAQQKKVATDLQSTVKDIDDWAIVRGYPPGHWALQPGFVQTGSPTIYCQAPSGKVLHRQDDYQGGGDEAAGALRKAKSSYDAKKDPDLRKDTVKPQSNSQLLTYGIAAVAGAGVMHLTKRRKQVAANS